MHTIKSNTLHIIVLIIMKNSSQMYSKYKLIIINYIVFFVNIKNNMRFLKNIEFIKKELQIACFYLLK